MAISISPLKATKLLLPVLIFVSILIVVASDKLGAIVIAAIIGIIGFILITYVSYLHPGYNILILLGLNFYVPVLVRILNLYELPLSIANEGICILMLLTLILNKRISGMKTLPAVLLLFWMGFQVVELLNPNAASRIAGIYSLRGQIKFLVLFIIMYSSVNSKSDALLFFKGWLIMGLTAGVYGIYQELMGLPSFDLAWATSDEEIYNLLFTWGRMRKFSFFFNPSEFGLIMAMTGVLALVYFFYTKKMRERAFAVICSLVCLWSLIYTGSRTAMVLLPVGFFAFSVITLHRKVLITMACAAVLGAAMILRPSSGAMFVMSTAFTGSDDPSMMVRIRNQELIRSYIRSNPIGFGLGSTGALGRKYSPDTFIGNFPPDSEFVRIAIETGWIGLICWCAILAILFGFGVTVYFKTRDNEWRMFLVMALIFLFMSIVGQYPQEVFSSQVLLLLFSCLLALMAKINFLITSRLEQRDP